MSKSTILLTLITLLIFGLMGVQAQDGAAKLELSVLVDGDVVEDFLSDDVQTRLYAFNGNEGDVVTISMTQISDELDPFLVLLGPAGQVIASDDDSGTEAIFAALIEDAELPMTGSYFIIASSFYYIDSIIESELGEELDYELSVSGMSQVEDMEDDFNFTAGTLSYGETRLGSSTDEKPVFFYVFEGDEGDIINIEMGSDDFDTILHVFTPGGARISVNNDVNGTNSAIEELELPADGLYLVFATDLFFYRANEEETAFKGGEFEITLTQE